MSEQNNPETVINEQYGITLGDLGDKGQARFPFNKAAQKRVSELLDAVAGPSFDQDQVKPWLTTRLTHINRIFQEKQYTPLEIAASHPKLHTQLMKYIDREIHWPGVN